MRRHLILVVDMVVLRAEKGPHTDHHHDGGHPEGDHNRRQHQRLWQRVGVERHVIAQHGWLVHGQTTGGEEKHVHRVADEGRAEDHREGAFAQDQVDACGGQDAYGAGEILLTSMDRDGTKIGFDNELTRAVSEAVRVPVIASGGVGNLQHLADGILEGRADAVLAASIFHFAEHSIGEAKAFMRAQGIEVRDD